jgi:hypothetical protein
MGEDVVWRVLPDGSLWLGVDTWDVVQPEAVAVRRVDPRLGKAELVLGTAAMFDVSALRGWTAGWLIFAAGAPPALMIMVLMRPSVLWALLFSGAMYLVAWILWKKRWFIKA